jgi:hypothetical protein
MRSLDLLHLMDFSDDGGFGFVRVMRHFDSRKRVHSRDLVVLLLGSEQDGGGNDCFMVNNGSNVRFLSGFFGGNKSGGFRGNIGEHTGGDFSVTRLGIVDPSVHTGSGADGIFFVSGHASSGGFTPTAVDVGGTEVTILDSQTKLVVVHLRKGTVIRVTDGSVDCVP